MSAVEEALERIKEQAGVEGYVVCNYDGVVLRRSASILKDTAENIAEASTFGLQLMNASSMTKLALSARNVTRDLNPNDDLKNLRIKTSKKELIVSHDRDFIVVVIQAWQPAAQNASHL